MQLLIHLFIQLSIETKRKSKSLSIVSENEGCTNPKGKNCINEFLEKLPRKWAQITIEKLFCIFKVNKNSIEIKIMAVQRQLEERKCNLKLESEVKRQFLIIFTLQTSSFCDIGERQHNINIRSILISEELLYGGCLPMAFYLCPIPKLC